jgi:Protein of unknown function (DUF3313)
MRRALCLIAGLFVLTVATAATVPPQSGFLDTYPTLQPDTKHPGSFIYIAPGGSLKGFTKVQIDPILVWYSKDSTYQGIDPNELSAVTENLRKALIKHLEPKYPVVDTAGPNVLRLRLAVTNVTAEKKKRGILGYTPVGFVITTAKNAATAGPNLNISSATLEAELLDSSGKQLAVVIDPLEGQDVQKENLTWADIGKILDAAGTRLRARLDSDNP